MNKATRRYGPVITGAEDLRDANAAVDWAQSQLPSLQKLIKSWADRKPYTFITEDHPETGKKLFKLRVEWDIPLLINAEVGAIINSTRSSLDLLAAALATRNGVKPSSDTHFPVYHSHQCFIDPMNAAKRKKWLREVDRIILESLRPYRGGNDALFDLHHLDITRKHTRLIKVGSSLDAVSVSAGARNQGLQFPAAWPGFDDGAVVAWTRIDATQSDFQITSGIAFNEADTGIISGPVWPALADLTKLAQSIIKSFDRG
jgi:hypothetical protein